PHGPPSRRMVRAGATTSTGPAQAPWHREPDGRWATPASPGNCSATLASATDASRSTLSPGPTSRPQSPSPGHPKSARELNRIICQDEALALALPCLLMTCDDARLWTDRSCLQDVQYRTDANLAARQSIYAYQRPRLDLPSRVLGLAALSGGETVADIGCGNGAYLAGLARRRHVGPVLGVDFSMGMLQAARGRAPGAALVAGDAAALPLRDNASNLTLAMHMLYHVPDPAVAVRELRRITDPGGHVLVVLNG